MKLNEDIAIALRNHLQKRIEDIVAEEAAAASKRVESRVKGMVAETTIAIIDKFQIETFGDHLRITVEHKRDQ